MNVGVDSWRNWLFARISDVIDRFGLDAYFLDIVGGWENNTKADSHEGTRRLVADLRAKYPQVMVFGEMHYDALLSFIPVFHVQRESAYGRPTPNTRGHSSISAIPPPAGAQRSA